MRSFKLTSFFVLSLAIGAFSSPTLDFLDPFLSVGSSGSGAVSGNVGGLGAGAAASGSLSGGAGVGSDLGVGLGGARDFNGGVGAGGAGAGLSGAASGHVGAGIGNLVGFDASGSIAGQKSIGVDGGIVPQPHPQVEDARILPVQQAPIQQAPVRIQPQPQVVRPLPPPPQAKPCAHPLPRPLGHGQPQPLRTNGHYRKSLNYNNNEQLNAQNANAYDSNSETNEIVDLYQRDTNAQSQPQPQSQLNAHDKSNANANKTKNGTLVEIVELTPVLFRRDAAAAPAHPQGQGQGQDHQEHKLNAQSQLPHDVKFEKIHKNETVANKTQIRSHDANDAAASSADRNISPKLSGVAHMFHNMFGGRR